MDKSKLRSTAIHEAGHVILALSLFKEVKEVTIIPAADGNYNGRMLHLSDGSISDMVLAEAIDNTMMSAAGAVAEQILGEGTAAEISENASADMSNINDYIFNMMDEAEAILFMRWIEYRTKSKLIARWDDVEKIAAALLEKHTLNRDQIIALIVG